VCLLCHASHYEAGDKPDRAYVQHILAYVCMYLDIHIKADTLCSVYSTYAYMCHICMNISNSLLNLSSQICTYIHTYIHVVYTARQAFLRGTSATGRTVVHVGDSHESRVRTRIAHITIAPHTSHTYTNRTHILSVHTAFINGHAPTHIHTRIRRQTRGTRSRKSGHAERVRSKWYASRHTSLEHSTARRSRQSSAG
jgi:hypothetical protein